MTTITVVGLGDVCPPLSLQFARSGVTVPGWDTDLAKVEALGWACYDEGTIYLLYNPFGEDTLREVLAKIKFTLEQCPRHVRMVYYSSVHAAWFQSCQWLQCFDGLRTLTGRPVTFWQNISRR